MKIVVKAMKQSNMSSPSVQPTKSESPSTIPMDNLQIFFKTFSDLSNGTNSVPGKQAVEYFTKSGLPLEFLKKIWDLCDYKKEGSLKKLPFCAAMYFITQKRKNSDFVLPVSLPSNITEEERVISAPILPTTSQSPNQPMTTPRGSLILENRVGSLMRDSSMLKDELFNTNNTLQEQSNKIEGLKEQEKNLMNEIRNTQIALEEIKGGRQKLLLEQSQVEARLLTLREEHKGNLEYLDGMRSELARLVQIKNRGEQSIVDLSTEVEHQTDAVQSEAAELEAKKLEIIKLKKQYEMLMIRKRDAEEDFSMSQLSGLKDEIRKLQQENDDLELKVVGLEGKNKEAGKGIVENEKILKEYREKNGDMKSRLQKAQKELDENASKPNLKPKLLKLKDLVENSNRCITEINKILEGQESDFTVDQDVFKEVLVKETPPPVVKPPVVVKETPKVPVVVKETPKPPVVKETKEVPKPPVVKEVPKPVPPPVDEFSGFDDFDAPKAQPKKTKIASGDFDFENEFNGFDEKKGGNDPWSGFDEFEFNGKKEEKKEVKKEVKAPQAPVTNGGFGDDFDTDF
jgi:hypothetical protein